MPPRPQPDPPSLQQLQDSINQLTTTFNAFRNTQDQRHQEYTTTIENLSSQIPGSSHTTPHSQTPTLDQPLKPPKLRLLPFDGTNPLDWVFQVNQFFTHYSIHTTHRLTHVPSYMTGDALSWY